MLRKGRNILDTEKKAKIAIFVGFAIIVVVGCLFGITSTLQNAEAEEVAEPAIPIEQVSDTVVENYEFPCPPWMEEGYPDLQTYWNDLTSKRSSFEGISAKMQEEFAGYFSEEDIAAMDNLEVKLTNCTSIQKIGEYEAELNNIVNAAKEARDAEIAAQQAATHSSSGSYSSGSGNYSGSYYQFLRDGIVYSGGKKFSYYSQRVLPGGGLNIPGRHVDGGFVRDGNGYICVANDAPIGTVISTPWGDAKVYDRGTSGNHYDVYVE